MLAAVFLNRLCEPCSRKLSGTDLRELDKFWRGSPDGSVSKGEAVPAT